MRPDLPLEWITAIRCWAVDEPMVRSVVALGHHARLDGEAPDRLRLALVTASDAFGDTLAPFIEGRKAWASALEDRLQVGVGLEHFDAVQDRSDHGRDGSGSWTIWPRAMGDLGAH